MRNPVRNLISLKEQNVLLYLCAILILGMGLQLFAGSSPASTASDSLSTILETDKQISIDIRTATPEELMLLPGIGQVRAQAIVDYRTAHPFSSVNQIMDVRGIGPKTYEALLPSLVIFGDSTAIVAGPVSNPRRSSTSRPAVSRTAPVNLNTASLEELCSLDGIGEVKAGAIISYREENGNFTRVEDLVKVRGIGVKTLEKNLSRLRVE